MTAKQVLEFAKKNNAEIVDLRFTDLPGLWQHFSISTNEFDAGLFQNGIGFDGSSIRGFQTIDESDMLLFPDPDTAFMDPFTSLPTLNLVCNIKDPLTGQPYTRDPRYVAQKAELYLKSTGIADTSFWGPEIEFYILDNVRFDQSYNYGFYYIDSDERAWNSGNGDKKNLGYKPRYKEGYFPVPPMDSLQDIRSEMVKTLDKNLYDLEPEEAARVESLPGSLEESLDALERDNAFLTKGDVFTKDVIEAWLNYKRTAEVEPMKLRPHPYEFALYYDI